MPNAASSELSEPRPGNLTSRQDSTPAAKQAGLNGRTISADSFKRLTARLKGAAAPVLAPVAPAVTAEIVPLVHVQAPEPAVAAEPPPPAGPVSVEPVAEAQSTAEPASLPEFRFIDAYVPAPAPVADDIAEEPSMVAAEFPVQAALPPLPPFVPTGFAGPDDTSFATGWDEPEDAAPAIEPAAAVPPATVEVAVELDAAELAALETLIFGEPQSTPEESIFALEESAAATAEPSEVLAEAFLPDIEPDAPTVIEYTVAEPAPEPVAAQSVAPEPAASEEAAPADAKAGSSEMAGRVVDAMMKTISTAIYAKPSASERAAFLREMAQLMHEAAELGEAQPAPQAVAPAGAVTAPAAVSPAQVMETPPAEPQALGDALATRVGPAAALLKPRADGQPDPFAEAAPRPRYQDMKPEETPEADEESGELALTLLDMMSGSTGSLPHERTLAADTLLRILPRIPVKQLVAVVERVAIMEHPPALLVAKLIRDPRAEVICPLLERCSHISDQDLMNAATDGDVPKLRMIARRRVLSTVLSDYLISTAEPGVLLTLIRNPGAALSHEAFFRLAEFAGHHHALLAPLTTRGDLPPPVAFELFWHVPSELRRFIFSRFLTDSETLNKILRITLSTYVGETSEASGEVKLPPREALAAALESAMAFRLDEAAAQFAELASIARDTALRILSDREGEPLTVLLKTLGCSRAKFEEVMTKLRQSGAGLLRVERDLQEMQAIFDGLSFNKARILLTYWDWYVRKSGPYAPHN